MIACGYWIRLAHAFALAYCALTFVGCAVGTKQLPLLDPLPVTGHGAAVAVWREKQFCGSYPVNYIVVDGRPIAALTTGQYTAFNLTPGRHTIGVYHHAIDMPLLVGGGPAAIPVGVHYGQYGTLLTAEFSGGTNYYFLLRSKCAPFNERDRIVIEQLEKWPDGATPDPQAFVRAGKRESSQSAP